MFGLSGVQNLSPDGAALKSFITREPISIFSQIKNVKDEEKKEKLKQFLEALRKELPEGFKIGAAVGEGDCFFDSVAQGLNELKDKGLIIGSRGFSVKSLRESCKQYAQRVDQSKEGSWLDNALKVEIEELCEYIPRIEFTAEDIKNASSGSEIKILKLENVIWGRSEIEGKMICEKYSVKIRIIELRDEEIDGVHVTKGEVGTGNSIIYIVNYMNHFVPLLSNIKKDIKRNIKVSREEAYGNVVANNISQSYISIPLRDVENSSHKQSSHSRSSGKENREIGVSSGKRKRSVTDKDSKVPKRAHIDINVTSDEISKFLSDLQDESKHDELDNTCQTKKYIPHHLIGLMYRLDLSVLCSLRKSIYEHKYPLLSLAFEGFEIDKFSSVVFHYKKKSIHIRIENVDKYYIDNDIGYARLFIKEKRGSHINNCFNSFVEHLISKSDNLSNNIEYLIIYTNSCLDLTEEKELKQRRSRNFYPLKFDGMNIEKYVILKDFLFTNDNIQGRGFYQFSQNKTTRRELLKRLEFSPAMQKVIKEREFSQECEREIKEAFLDKLVFAVNQPSREELNSIVKSEIEKNSKVQVNYMALQERVLRDLMTPEKHKKLGNCIPEITYGFNLLMSFLHGMFLHKNIFSISFEEKSYGISNGITLHYEDKITYIKAHNGDSNIGYSKLFPSRKQNNMFSINKHLTLFIEELKENTEYFIIYTNADLDLTEEKELKKGQSRDFYPLKFDSIDMETCDILKDFLFTDDNAQGRGFYQFSQDKTTREELLKRLEFSSAIQKVVKERKLFQEEIKEAFLDKLVFAVNQPSREELNGMIKSEIEKNNESNKVPYNYGELHEIALRWLESREFSLTKRTMKKLFEDIKNNRSSCQRTQNKNNNEKRQFAKSVVGKEGRPAFYQFLDFLSKKKGIRCLEVLKREGISLVSMSSVLHGAGANATKAFKDLYDLWFDKQGNKTQYLKTLEENGVNLSNVSSILSGARANAAKAFKDLYDLWFDKQGNKTQYLKTLEENGINLPNISNVLNGAGANAAETFKDLYDLWFDKQGNKTQYLKTLEENRINLTNISSILGGAGVNAVQAFKGLYKLWFNEQGNKTQYLKTLEKEEINLPNMSSILNGAGANAAQAFKGLYDLWFDKQGNKTQYLKNLEENGVNLPNVSSILHRARANAAQAFKGLYDLWFDEQGNKTQYLKALEEEGINISDVSNILHGAGSKAPQAFEDLYKLWFDKQGNKTQYLKTLEENRINLTNISGILGGAGANAAQAFKGLYDLWFDKQGNKTQYLKTLEENGVNLSNVSSILSKAGANAAQAFKGLYDLWFDKQGSKTQYLKTLEKEEINLPNMSSILNGAGANAAQAFKGLYDLWFDKQGNKTQYLKTLEENGVNLSNVSSILSKAGANAAQAFKSLYDLWFDKQGNKTQYLKTLEKEEINLPNMSSILSGAGANAARAFEGLYDLWFDKQGNKTQYLKILEENGVNLSNVSSILSKTGANAAQAFKGLYDLWFDEQGNKTQYLKTLEENRINLTNISSILGGAGANAAQAFKGLYDLWFDMQGDKKQHLKHFTEKGNKERNFAISNLSGILNGAGAKASNAFKELHDVCFNDNGEETELLSNFYDVGFKPGNLSSMLCGSGFRASHRLKKFHNTLFDDKGKETGLLSDFRKIGFNPQSLCSILSASVSSLEQFHDFCFTEEAKAYFIHFSQGGFTINNLSNILHGARASIYSALKDFHNVCFDEQGNNTQLLNDFHSVGFTASHLSTILGMAGNNSASILKNFHKSCFNERNYLSHFLTEKKLFTPKDISYMLGRIGISVHFTFKKLHDLCFDEAGNRKSYLDDLIKNKQKKVNRIPDALYRNEILNILYKEVRNPYFTVSDEQSVEDRIINTDLESNSLFSIAEQGSDSLQQNSSEFTEKKQIDQSNNRKDHEATSTVADGSESLPSKQGRKKKQIQLVYHNKEIFSYLLQFTPLIESVKQGLYLPSFKERGIKIDGKCIAITRGLSQALFLHSDKSFLSNLETSAEIYERIAQGKQVSKREEREVFAFSVLLDDFEQQPGSLTNSLPSNLIHTEEYKAPDDLSHYVAGIKGGFVIHLVASNHVIAIYRTGNNYAYFDSNAAFVSGLKSVDQLMQIVEEGVKSAGYKVGERGFFIEHFDVAKANSLLSDEGKQILTKEIKTERQLLAEQDKEFGLVKINDQELSRVQLYDFGTKVNVEGSVPLLINAEMNLNSKKFQDHLDKREVSMTAREYFNQLKGSKNVEGVVQATKAIPFIGSKREIEEAEQTRKPKFSLKQSIKHLATAFRDVSTTASAVSPTNTSQSESQLPKQVDDKPGSYLSGVTANNQLKRLR